MSVSLPHRPSHPTNLWKGLRSKASTHVVACALEQRHSSLLGVLIGWRKSMQLIHIFFLPPAVMQAWRWWFYFVDDEVFSVGPTWCEIPAWPSWWCLSSLTVYAARSKLAEFIAFEPFTMMPFHLQDHFQLNGQHLERFRTWLSCIWAATRSQVTFMLWKYLCFWQFPFVRVTTDFCLKESVEFS